MNSEQRRAAILDILTRSDKPVSATALAGELAVSRQIIVGDVALLRAAGESVVATARGYVMAHPGEDRRTVVCCHPPEDMERELNLMVDFGCTVEDVVVEHPVYGQLSGRLDVASRYDVREFARRVAESGSRPLSDLTAGIHTHTLRCPDDRAFEQLLEALREAGFLVE
jgi:transcriptional regulator of NAD metabolism